MLDFSKYRTIRDTREIIAIIHAKGFSPVAATTLLIQSVTVDNALSVLHLVEQDLGPRYLEWLVGYCEATNFAKMPEPVNDPDAKYSNIIENGYYTKAFRGGVRAIKQLVANGKIRSYAGADWGYRSYISEQDIHACGD